MPRKQANCARGAGHPPPCATPEAMERQRQRAAERVLVHGRSVNPVVKALWRQAYKLQRYGLTEERSGTLYFTRPWPRPLSRFSAHATISPVVRAALAQAGRLPGAGPH